MLSRSICKLEPLQQKGDGIVFPMKYILYSVSFVLVPVVVSMRLTDIEYQLAYTDLNSTESRNLSIEICDSVRRIM